MSIDWTALRTACRAAVAAVWTDTPANGIWPVDRIERVPLEQVDLPFAVILYSAAEISPEWSGMTNQGFLLDLTFYYVFQIDLVTEYGELAATKAELLRVALLSAGITGAKVIEAHRLANTQDDLLNALILDKQKPFFTGSVGARVLFGETGD